MPSYRDELEAWAKSSGSDGCTVVPELYRVCCLEHDFSYVHSRTPRGVFVTKAQADQRFRDCIQTHSPFRWLSPLSWWRWLAVSWFGRGVWSEQPPRAVTALFGRASLLVAAERARRRIVADVFKETDS